MTAQVNMRQMQGAIKQQGAAVTEKQLMIITATDPQPYVASWQGTTCGNGDFIEIRHGNTSHTSQTMLFSDSFLGYLFQISCVIFIICREESLRTMLRRWKRRMIRHLSVTIVSLDISPYERFGKGDQWEDSCPS